MSTTASALDRNAAAAQTSRTTEQTKLTLPQQSVIREFTENYDIDPEQIWFEGDSDKPVFDYDALLTLAHELTNIPSIIVELGDVNHTTGLVTASCELKLNDGRTRVVFGSAIVGETLHGRYTIDTIHQALNVAQARGLRKGLRFVSLRSCARSLRTQTWRGLDP